MLLINNDCNKTEWKNGIPVFRNNNSHISMYGHLVLQAISYNHQCRLTSK